MLCRIFLSFKESSVRPTNAPVQFPNNFSKSCGVLQGSKFQECTVLMLSSSKRPLLPKSERSLVENCITIFMQWHTRDASLDNSNKQLSLIQHDQVNSILTTSLKTNLRCISYSASSTHNEINSQFILNILLIRT